MLCRSMNILVGVYVRVSKVYPSFQFELADFGVSMASARSDMDRHLTKT